MTKRQKPLPPELRDGQYRSWEVAMATRFPLALSEMLIALDWQLGAPKEVVIVTPHSFAEAEPFLAKLRRSFIPNRVLLVAAEGPGLDALAKLAPVVAEKTARGGKPTAYVCERRVCALPTSDPEAFARQLAAVPARRDGN